MSAGENPLDVLREVHEVHEAEGYFSAAEWEHVGEALAAVERLVEAARQAESWEPQLEVSMAHLHPQHRDALLALRAALEPFGGTL